ncbi:MAG: hypothetical protein QM755_24120 [Luteolibacter sp.]
MIAAIIPDELLELLEPLGRGELQPDPDQTIQGCALGRLVGAKWSLRQALPYLKKPGERHFLGSYRHFLNYGAPSRLTDEDIVSVLKWLNENQPFLERAYDAGELIQKTIQRAIDLIDSPEIAEAVASIFIRARDHYRLIRAFGQHPIFDDQHGLESRAVFLKTYLDHPGFKREDGIEFLRMGITNLSASDSEWIFKALQETPENRQAIWAYAIGQLIRYQGFVPAWDNFIRMMNNIPALYEEFDGLKSWGLDEPRSLEAKSNWEKRSQWSQKPEPPEENTPPEPSSQIRKILSDNSSGTSERWFHLWNWLSTGYYQIPDDIRQSSHWRELSENEKKLCLEIAQSDLAEIGNHPDRYLPNTLGRYATFSAFMTIPDEDLQSSTATASLPDAVVEALVHHACEQDGDNIDQQIARLHKVSPEITISTAANSALSKLVAEGDSRPLKRLKPFWSPLLVSQSKEALKKIEDPKIKARALEALSDVDEELASTEALRYLDAEAPQAGSYPLGLSKALIAALRVAPRESFHQAMRWMAIDHDLARCVWIDALYGRSSGAGRILGRLDVVDLSLLFEFFWQIFPEAHEPPTGAGFVVPREEALRNRDQIPAIMANRACEEAYVELSHLADKMPERSTELHWHMHNAAIGIRRNNWIPPKAKTVSEILLNPETRWLRNSDDLLELVLESLDRLQLRTNKSVHPIAEGLWNRRTPKKEEQLSNFIAAFLDDDIGEKFGLSVTREPQPRTGRRVDILIQTLIGTGSLSSPKATVVIEVKGCWNPGIRTSLKSQLVDSYLKDHNLRCGIYLVGWFLCPRWRRPKIALTHKTFEGAKSELESYAQAYQDGKNPLIRVEPFLLNACP